MDGSVAMPTYVDAVPTPLVPVTGSQFTAKNRSIVLSWVAPTTQGHVFVAVLGLPIPSWNTPHPVVPTGLPKQERNVESLPLSALVPVMPVQRYFAYVPLLRKY